MTPIAVDYVPVLVAVIFGVAFSCIFTFIALNAGPKHLSAEKLATFECGSEPIGSPRVRFSVKFYQVAILFVVFDIESAFMYPWSVLFRRLSCDAPLAGMACTGNVTFFGFGEMLTFLAVVLVALAYVWRKRAIGWG